MADEKDSPLEKKARKVRRLWFDRQTPEKQDSIIRPVFENEMPPEKIRELAKEVRDQKFNSRPAKNPAAFINKDTGTSCG